MRYVGVILVLVVLVGWATPAAADSVNCTTLFANSDMPMTNCNGSSGSVNCTTYFAHSDMPMTNCDTTSYAPPPAPSYASAPPPPPDPGFYYRDENGVEYAKLGTFFKGANDQAIYVAGYGQLHAFRTWGQYLSWGGKSDLSNVLVFNSIPSSVIGMPVPN